MHTDFITINAHSSIRIDAGPGAVCYVDPYLLEDAPHDADLVLVTHSHHDHYSPEDIARVACERTRFVAPRGMERELPDALFVSPGETVCPLPSLSIEAVPAYNKLKPFAALFDYIVNIRVLQRSHLVAFHEKVFCLCGYILGIYSFEQF